MRYKRLSRGRFLWPSLADGSTTISTVQLSYLLSGIDWRNLQETWRPTRIGYHLKLQANLIQWPHDAEAG
ncbi:MULTISPECIES: IS66 family insertion sequence element accessory protein TnpB [unclassified Mesorhizobium]|uniref:IS66 family insertion sequence element accessory protein TnpB n=1 Tax=unclassified Mesorhizobium TaxID=325217 RepID=UPI0033370AF3